MKCLKTGTFLLIILLGFISCTKESVVDPTDYDTLDRVLESEFTKYRIPGMAYVSLKNDSILIMEAKGYADVAKEKAFTPQTRMNIASISKTIVATAIMQLYEQEKLELDSDINQYLPFQISNPHYPAVPLTIKMLLTHTSSISDKNNVFSLFQMQGFVDYPQALSQFLGDVLTTEGQYYKEDTYTSSEPGTFFEYSNIGASLAGLIVETVSGLEFNEYCKSKIFLPLGMNSSSFLFSETPKEEIAIPYYDVNVTNPDNPFFSYPDYPAGHLITTIEDMSKFLRAYIMDGSFNGYQLLEKATIELMLQPYLLDGPREQGFIWRSGKIGNTTLWRHGGADTGITTNMGFDPITKAGFIVFMNRHSCYPLPAYVSLLKYAQQ